MDIEIRGAPGTQLSSTALAATLTGVGVVIIGVIVVLVVLLVREKWAHRRHLADLEERGLVIAQSQRDAKRDTITRPRAVLRRSTILPFNAKSGWGALSSVETIAPPEPPSFPPHYAPPKPAGFVSKPKRLSWPFSARRGSGSAIHMRKILVPTLSTVLESPKPSPLVPVLGDSLRGEPSSPKKNQSRPSSDQSLLRHHPAFRSTEQESKAQQDTPRPERLRRSLTAKPTTKPDTPMRPNRSKSVTDISVSTKASALSPLPRPKLRARSASMCSQSSGTAPDGDLPPLPLDVARLKSEARRKSLLSRSPSRVSVSSFESAGSSILATQSSPILPRPSNARVQKVTKRDWRNSLIIGPRPFRDTLALHRKNQRSQSSIKSSVARFSSVDTSTQAGSQTQSRRSTLTKSSSMQSTNKAKTAGSVSLSKTPSPVYSPRTVRNLATPKCKSGCSFVTPYGSPEERRKRSSLVQSASGNNSALKRQLSETSTRASSTRSSNGNPFQWDPAPMSAGKPSALKGSPSARKGHRRQNCVRISLIPTMLGPPSRSPSPCMNDIQEEPSHATFEKTDVGLGFSSTRALPRPPSISTFAPELKLISTSIRASLTPSSPTLSIANYDHRPTGSPVMSRPGHVLSEISEQERKRQSTGSIFSIPTFPSPVHGFGSGETIASAPPTFTLSQTWSGHANTNTTSDTAAGASSPFDMLLDIDSSPGKPLLTNEYDPERPYLIYQTPTSSPTRTFSSPFSTIPEEPSAQSSNYERLRSEDSPPCSPKTVLPPTFGLQQDRSAYSLPIKETAIPEEPLGTIDPAILSKDAFSTLNTGLSHASVRIMKTPNSSRDSTPIPTSPGSARFMFEPLLEATFPSSPPLLKDSRGSPSAKRASQSGLEPPTISVQSSPSSMYSSPFPAPSPSQPPSPPCSPRPQHTQLPPPSLNFIAMPTLSPSICGPRGSPPRPLRSSIQKLRRMNSDAEKGGREERRYLRLGREESIALPGEESWLDGLNGEGDEEDDDTWDEEKGKRLVEDILNDWEEEATMLDSEDGKDAAPTPTLSTQPEGETKTREIEESKGLLVTSSSKPSPPAVGRSSSIWEDGEKFWHSTPPHPPNSPNKPKQRFQPLSSSPLATPRTSRKRDFEVAKDESPTTTSQQEDANPTNTDGKKGNTGHSARRRSLAGNRYRKRSALGISTPNVRIQIQPPSGGSLNGTPGSLYDADGFLRV